MSVEHAPPLPLSHPVRVELIRQRGTEVALRAEPDQFAAIAAMLGLASLEELEARYLLSRNGDRVKLEGRIAARLHQTCVVTLDPFPVRLEVPLKLDFAPEEEAPTESRRGEQDDAEIDIEVLLNEDDPPEPIINGVIDLGSVTLEFLALALDPYPRKPGVSFEAPAGDAGQESPFAALAKLKRGD